MSGSAMNDGVSPGEGDPLLGGQDAAAGRTGLFRRSRPGRVNSRSTSLKGGYTRSSVRLPADFTVSSDDGRKQVKPVDALAPLVAGGVIIDTDGYRTESRPPSAVKSLPAFAPFRRMARHRSFYLWWLNEFRHWWKSSRLLVRLAGLFTLAFTLDFFDRMENIDPFETHRRANAKNTRQASKIVKSLGRGGPMSFFLDYVQIFTRTIRIVVAGWRWIESAQCRRGEVGVEETMAFIGNRVSRMVARNAVDLFVMYIAMPVIGVLFKTILPADWWHPVTFLVIMGIMRSVAPYAASFQGSRVGRVLTRQFFASYTNRWQPVQLVQTLNLLSDDCWEKDEVSQTADLAVLAKRVATALGKAHQIGVDTMQGQLEALGEQGFCQVGAGSGGYAVYECRRRVMWTSKTSPEGQETPEEGEETMLLLHVTPYGPSILDVMPRYIVLEFEDSVDRRAKWSEYVSKKIYEGPPVLEGYCYQGAFFSPHHFAELKEKYDEELFMYDRACKSMCKPRTGRNPSPPADLRSLKAFLFDGKFGRQRKKNAREARSLQNKVQQVADELKALMKTKNPDGSCSAPNGIILYFEGLDCSGKSSTGGLVEEAMRRAGYSISMEQYNRPPTAEQKRRPWMDRFAVPGATVAVAIQDGSGVEIKNETIDKCINHSHNALVWDRGPAGDFVYGALAEATPEQRLERYREFMAFDKEMFEKKILFCKLLFVTNRDSIASTLGKRLAQKKMAKDLRTWLQASRGGESGFGDIGFEGLDEISLHIDPTDFVAFNSYQRNLRIFTNFALNTDSEANPWLVVNTGNRFAARKQLLKSFSVKLQRFKTKRTWSCCPSTATTEEEDTPGISEAEMLERGFKKPLPTRWVVALAGIILLVFYYCEHTTFGHTLSLFIHHNNSTEAGDSEN